MRQAFVISLITGAGLLVLWSSDRDQDRLMDHFGSTLASSLANQVVEPFLAKDLIHLGVLANRIIELEQVNGATIYALDDRMLAVSGDPRRGRPYTEQIIHDNATIGFVRLHIDAAAFSSTPSWWVIAASLLWMALVPAALIALRALSGWSTWFRPEHSTVAPSTVQNPARGIEETADPATWYLIAVNLFNQLSLTPEQAAKELSFARRTGSRVAGIYDGRVQDLPGTGLLLTFRSTDSDDRPFHVLCAAFALSALLAEAESWGRYRLAIHAVTVDDERLPAPGDESVTDAAILSALARDNTIVISQAYFERIPYSERLNSESMTHLLLEELTTIGGGALVAHSLADPHNELVAQQVADISYSERSTASESTF